MSGAEYPYSGSKNAAIVGPLEFRFSVAGRKSSETCGPPLLIRMDTWFANGRPGTSYGHSTPDTRSGHPSWFMSATATDIGQPLLPSIDLGAKVPSPFPRRIEVVLVNSK